MKRMARAHLVICAFLLGAGIVLWAALPASAQSSTASPNVVLIIADDLAWDDIGAYGNKKIRTPNIDRLAREGMKFTSAFVTISSCSPSRSSLITGRYPHNTDAEQLHWPLPAEQVTFVEKLKAAGYWTAASGKWHLGDYVRDRFDLVDDPGEAGFHADDAAATKKQAVFPVVCRARPASRLCRKHHSQTESAGGCDRTALSAGHARSPKRTGVLLRRNHSPR
jgi:arylsulfatase A-like enzyme